MSPPDQVEPRIYEPGVYGAVTAATTMSTAIATVVSHRLHTNGVPFGHPAMDIPPGQSADYVLQSTFSPPAFLYSHLYGQSIQFFLRVPA